MSSVSPPSPSDRSEPVADAMEHLTGRTIVVLAPPGEPAEVRDDLIEHTLHVASLTEMMDRLEGLRGPLVMIHAGTVSEPEIELAASIIDLPCQPIIVVAARNESLSACMNIARRLGLGHVLPADALLFPQSMDRWLGWIESGGPGPGLAPHLDPGTETNHFRVTTREDKSLVIGTILDRIHQWRPDESFHFDARLLLEETLNNAIFHSVHTADGKDKYSIESFEKMAEDEIVRVEIGADEKTIGLAIIDNQGSLRRDKVLEKLERQLGEKGLLDQTGRGLYLTYSMSGRLIFNLDPGKATELVLLFPRTEDSWPEGPQTKPLLIFDDA